MKRLLVTGGSGLLGTAIVKRVKSDFSCVALSNTSVLPETISIDLLAVNSISRIKEMDWDAIVNCAAFRSPDFCETHRDEAINLNAHVPEQIAQLANERQARMLHISTDYVFDGRNPPYSESDPTCPINYYGETKLKAEELVMDAHPDAVVLRIPALYGDPPKPIVSALLDEGLAAARSKQATGHDDIITRYPTYTGDIAEVVLFLLKSNYSGIIHASAPEKATRYKWAKDIAAILKLDDSNITPLDHDPTRNAARPVNSKLSVELLKSIGAPLPRPYNEILPSIITE